MNVTPQPRHVILSDDSLGAGRRCVPKTRRDNDLREAVLHLFSQSLHPQAGVFTQISRREWDHLLTWLDVSGLALYFLDRMREIGLLRKLPQLVVEQLQGNLHDNSQRTLGMIAESIAIQQGFQSNSIRYAVLKGISLCPSAVLRPELRHQFDLDYLVADTDADKARRVLERLGYSTHAESERCWEFKKGESPTVTAKDLYKDLPYRGVELHLEHSTVAGFSGLDQVISQTMHGMTMPLLSPIALFISHAMDVFKDICSSFIRASHLLEFYRHVLTRFDDDRFWNELQHRVAGDRNTRLGIAVVSYLITSLMGEFAPDILTTWSICELSPATRLWIDRYGRQAAFATPPGTKLYLLLRRELELDSVLPRQTLRTSLLPSRLPRAVMRASRDEDLSTRIARYRAQARFSLSRLRFHCIEG